MSVHSAISVERADNLAATLALFRKHTGIWEGTYTHALTATAPTDTARINIELHRSRLELELNGMDWFQRNTYSYHDGREISFEFQGSFTEAGILVFDTPRLYGEAWKNGPYVLLNWQYRECPTNNNHELITLITDNHRMRTWQCEQEGTIKEFVLIEEYKVS